MASTTAAGTKTGSGWIEKWNPEDKEFWESEGKYVARRNLIFSIFAEFLGFSVWQLFSIVAALLPAIGFAFTSPQLFGFVALPGLVGATMRFPYTFAVGLFGGRNWTIISALLLLIPTVMLGIIVQNPDTPYWQFAVAAVLGGFGGGNFSSSMANISYFYPSEKKGTALGINAAGGNLGVGVVQLIVPLVITLGALGFVLSGDSQTRQAAEGATGSATGVASTEVFVQNAAFVWVPLILISAVCAFFFMNNLNVSRASPSEQLCVTRRKHTWIMSYLYIGTFGSFIGYSASFPLLISSQFPEYTTTWLAALGPIVGAIARPIGGLVSDRIGGARVTFWNFIVMAFGVVAVLFFLAPGSFTGFFLAFMVLFLTAGIGNGSTYRMIPRIYSIERVREVEGGGEAAVAEAKRQGLKESAFVLGFAGAIAAYGGFVIPQAYKYSIGATGGPQTALISFIVFYVTCVAVTWYFYYRKNAEIPC